MHPRVVYDCPYLYQIAPGASGPLSPPQQATLSDRADEVSSDLAALHRDGSLNLVITDADFFVERLTRAVGAVFERLILPEDRHALGRSLSAG